MKINESEQSILKKALRCLREKESSKGNDVRHINDLLDAIQREIKEVNKEVNIPNPKKEYMEKIKGRTQ